MNLKKIPKKTIIMIAISTLLGGYSAWDALSTSSKPVVQSTINNQDAEDDIYKNIEPEPVQIVQEFEPIKEVQPIEKEEPPFQPLPPSYFSKEEGKQIVKVVEKPKQPAFKLSKEAQIVLDNLESQYANDVQLNLVNSQIALKEAQGKLAEINKPKAVEKTEVKEEKQLKAISLKDRMTISSIIIASKNKRAWVNVDGEDIPIAEGAVFYGVKVVSISSNSVMFQDLISEEIFQKHFNHQIGGVNE